MEMTEDFNSLKELQGILGERYEVEKQIEAAPKQLNTQESLLARLKKEYSEINAEYQSVKSEVGKLKIELDQVVASRESGEKNMDNVTTHREYEALDKQIAEASAKEKDVRASLQKEEKILEEKFESLQSYESLINSQESDLAEGRAALDKQISDFKSQLDDLVSRENNITSNLDDEYQETIHKFHSIIRRNKEGIVAVRNGVCTGCHMILPGQFANDVRSGENILFCPYCSRILFYEETGDEEQEDYSTLDETGSLADFVGDEFDDLSDDMDESSEGGLDADLAATADERELSSYNDDGDVVDGDDDVDDDDDDLNEDDPTDDSE